jgi:hypothetical protein
MVRASIPWSGPALRAIHESVTEFPICDRQVGITLADNRGFLMARVSPQVVVLVSILAHSASLVAAVDTQGLGQADFSNSCNVAVQADFSPELKIRILEVI